MRFVPNNVVEAGMVLLLAAFIGFEREERRLQEQVHGFGGIRTFPMIGLISYALALVSGPELGPWMLGFASVAALMLLSYHQKLGREPSTEMTAEVSALATFLLGALVQRGYYWMATTIAVVAVMLLELKRRLEGLTKHLASGEII